MTAVSTTVSAAIAAPREALYGWLVRGVLADELQSVSKSTLGIAGVERTSEATGPWDVPGSSHIVYTTDGSQAREEVTAVDAPHAFGYRVTDFTQPMIRRLAREARGQWRLTDVGAGTRVHWDYAFEARAPWALPILFPLIKLLFTRYMRSTLESIRARAEAEVKATS